MTKPSKAIISGWLFLTMTFGLTACGLPTESGNQGSAAVAKSSDTIIVKRQHLLTKSYEVGFYSKSYSYYWLAGKDTLDFILNASERKKDYRKYAPDADLADYPEIIIGGMNLYVHLENTGS